VKFDSPSGKESGGAFYYRDPDSVGGYSGGWAMSIRHAALDVEAEKSVAQAMGLALNGTIPFPCPRLIWK
jgi:hypothetical protein